MKSYTYSGEEYDPDYYNGNDRHTPPPRRDQRPETPPERPRRRPASSRRRRESSPNKLVRFFRNKSMRIILGSILLFVAVILTASFISYFTNGTADQSAVAESTVGQMAQDTDSVSNIAGPVGASASYNFITRGLGIGSIVLIIYLVILALALYGFKKVKFWQLTFKSLILAITISFVLGLFTVNSENIIPLGGYHGRYLNLMIISYIGWFGALAFSGLLTVIVVALFLSDIVAFYNAYKTRKRITLSKKVREQDKEDYTRERMEEALADGPMARSNKADKEEENRRTNSLYDEHINMSNVPAEEIVRTDQAAPLDQNNNGADTNVSGDASFVIQEKEIEQGVGDTVTNAEIQGPYDPKAELSRYRMPSLTLLHDRPRKSNSVDLTEQEENKNKITKTLNDYGVQIQHITATVGPTVTLYEIIPAEGVRTAKIKRLEDDIALSLAALGIRIIAPIPGKGTIGIEVPNKEPQVVSIRSILGSKAYRESKYRLPLAIGAKIDNEVFITDLAKMPHLLVAGATGQGKSVGLNAIIASLLYKLHPAELKFVLIDPKQVEFSLYNRIENHYLAKLPDDEEAVINDPTKAINTLNSLCVEMEKRYSLLKEANVRDIKEYNDRFVQHRLNPEKGHRYLPYIVIIVDEFADLIMMSGKAVETPIARIAQKARAVGMHMIIATQRPSTNVITGIIKANFPARMAFRVSQMVDSRTIIDAPGANQLIGRGDMLILNNGVMERVQCALIDTDEVEALCQHINDQIGYPNAYPLPEPLSDAGDIGGSASYGGGGGSSERDSLFEEVARWIVQDNTASTSSLQRRYSIGFNRAGKIMDQLEQAGIVGPAQGGKPRQVLVDPTSIDSYL